MSASSRALLGIVIALGILTACESGTPQGMESGSGTGSNGTGGGTISGGGPITGTLLLDAGSSGAFGPVAVGAGGGEGELFFSQATDAGYAYFLQHLTPTVGVSKDWVTLASGTPTSPPRVAVSSSGKEVTCCWEDWGGINGSHTAGEVIRCNTVAVGGTAPDNALHGGFSDVGSKPALVRGATNTAVAYAASSDEFVFETVLDLATPGTRQLQTQFPPYDWHLAPDNAGFSLFVGDGGAIDFSPQGPQLQNDGGLSPTGVPGAGSFAVAANSSPTTSTVIVAHQGSSVVASIFGPAVPPVATLSAAGEAPTNAVAAASCSESIFGVAYGLSGGQVVLRAMTLDGTTGPERVISTGFDTDVTALGLAAVDGGVLLAAGTPTQIAVFSVPCP